MSQGIEQASRRDWMAIYGAALGAFIAVLDIQIINASLADIQGALSASVEEGSWISTAYMIAEIVMIPLSGWLVQVLSFRTYIRFTIVLFVAASMLCGLAWSLESMILFRVLQGIGAAPLIPLAFSLVRLRLPASDQAKGMALFSFSAVFAPAIGPSLGGWLTETFSWHLIFYINLVPGIIMFLTLSASLDKEPMQLNKLREADWPGIFTLSLGLATLEYFLEEGNRKDWFGSDIIIWTALIAAVSLVAFTWLQLTRERQLLNLRLLGQRQFLMATLANMGLGLGMYGSVYILPLYLSQVQGYNSLQIGEVLMWGGMPQLLLIPMVPRLMKQINPRIMATFGFVMMAFSMYLNTNMTGDYAGDQFRISLLIRALGQPFIMIPLSMLAMKKILPKDVPSASSLFNTSRNLSGAIGIALLATIIQRHTTLHAARLSETLPMYGDLTQHRLDTLSAAMPQLSFPQQVGLIARQLTEQATIMAYSDAFYVVAIVLVLGLGATILTSQRGTLLKTAG